MRKLIDLKVDWWESQLMRKSIDKKVDWWESQLMRKSIDVFSISTSFIVYPHSCGCGYIDKRCGYIGFGHIRCGYIKRRCGYIHTYPHLF